MMKRIHIPVVKKLKDNKGLVVEAVEAKRVEYPHIPNRLFGVHRKRDQPHCWVVTDALSGMSLTPQGVCFPRPEDAVHHAGEELRKWTPERLEAHTRNMVDKLPRAIRERMTEVIQAGHESGCEMQTG